LADYAIVNPTTSYFYTVFTRVVLGTPTSTRVVVINSDGTKTIIEGTGLAGFSDLATGGTITSITHTDASGSVVYETMQNFNALNSDFATFWNATSNTARFAYLFNQADVLTGTGREDFFIGWFGSDQIIGGGGIDTVSYETSPDGYEVHVDLQRGRALSGTQEDVLVGITNAIGTAFNDSFIGNSSANILDGGMGDDSLSGFGGADTLIGGGGSDTANYYTSGTTAGITINLASSGPQAGGHAEGDILIGIENVRGTEFNDILIGNDQDNQLLGAGGDDFFVGGGGADLLISVGNAVASYASSSAAVNVNLITNVNTGGDAQGDRINGIRSIIGSNFDDTLTGNTFATLEGGAGADSINGGIECASSYEHSDAGVTVSLLISGPQISAGDASGDVLTNIASLIGSSFNDTLIGNAQFNALVGGSGDDLLIGGGGSGDWLDGGDGLDTVSYAGSGAAVKVDLTLTGSQTSNGEASGDTIVDVENVIGSAHADTLKGTSGVNILDGGSGDDAIDGNGGDDFIMAGDGDDTIVFNAGLLASNVQGGTGTDTLLINGGTAPTWFNLVTAGIEQARYVVVGTNSTTTNTYNQAWQLLESTVQNTDGSRLKTSYDPTNASTVWSSITEAFNTANQLTSRDTFFDATYAASPGGRSKQFFDYSVGINWSSITGNYSAGNALMNEVTVLDNGTYSVKYFDFDSSKGWTSILDTFTAGGALATETIVYDTGTVAYSVQTFDTTGQTWTSILQNYSSGGVLMNETTNYDNGQRFVNYLDYQNNQSWTNIINTFNNLNVLMTETTNYDSGARQVFYNDLTNQTWTNITDLFDNLNRLDIEITRYDNGNLLVTDFDQNTTNNSNGEYAWLRDVQTFNASNVLIEHYRVMDDGSIVFL
jgi:Ca2+-binding RTX toxin-like protein